MEKVDGNVKGSVSKVQDISGKIAGTRNVAGGITSAPMVVAKDYEDLTNRPKIEGNELVGDKKFTELGLDEITPQDIDKIIYGG